MPNFRVKKPTKKKVTNIKNSNTLDKKHKQKIKIFKKEKKTINKLNNELNKINHELSLMENKRSTFTQNDLDIRSKLLDKRDEIEEKIESIQNNDQEMDYYNIAGDLITDYYKLRDCNEKEIKQSKSILEYLNPDKVNKNKEQVTRAMLFDKFCKRTEGIKVIKHDGTNRIKYCEECGIEKTLDIEKSSYICSECGDMELIIIDEDRQIKEYSPYKKLNHFREWLIQIQAKETTEISDEIYKNIVKELNKNRIVDLKYLNREKMQSILKKLGYNNLYEHIPYILSKLSNIPPPKISRETEKNFLLMFKQIQEPWLLYKKKIRKNFMSYSYIFYKFSELCELDHLLDFFPLLKSSKKLKDQDEIWKKICNHLKWEFIPTEPKK